MDEERRLNALVRGVRCPEALCGLARRSPWPSGTLGLKNALEKGTAISLGLCSAMRAMGLRLMLDTQARRRVEEAVEHEEDKEHEVDANEQHARVLAEDLREVREVANEFFDGARNIIKQIEEAEHRSELLQLGQELAEHIEDLDDTLEDLYTEISPHSRGSPAFNRSRLGWFHEQVTRHLSECRKHRMRQGDLRDVEITLQEAKRVELDPKAQAKEIGLQLRQLSADWRMIDKINALARGDDSDAEE